jgi:hypothetical protein
VGVQERNAYVHQASIGEYESVMTAPPPQTRDINRTI